MIERAAYSYRTDPQVPDFDDSGPLFVFDSGCVLCSGGASWIMRRLRAQHVKFASAQGSLGRALYQHYGLRMDDSYLFIRNGRASIMSDGYFELASEMGGPWRLAQVGRIIPRAVRDATYGMIARNRYRWFGKTEACVLFNS